MGLPVYLHIGFDKTGSTALQYWLFSQRQKLSEFGVIYPVQLVRSGNGGKSFLYRNQTVLTAALVSEEAIPSENLWRFGGHEKAYAAARALIADISDAAARPDAKAIVLSSEALYSLPYYGVQRLAQIFAQNKLDPQIICYVRDPASRYAAAALQRLRNASCIAIPAGQAALNYVERFSRVFGPEKVSVANYGRVMAETGDVIGDFCKRTGIPAPDAPVEMLNRTLSAEGAFLLSNLIHLIKQSGKSAAPAFRKQLNAEIMLFDHVVAERSKASLKADIAAYVQSASTDYVLLNERYDCGFEISDTPLATHLPFAADANFSDLFQMNSRRYEELALYFNDNSLYAQELGFDLQALLCTQTLSRSILAAQ